MTQTDWRRRAAGVVAGTTSTGSKRAEALYGVRDAELPSHYVRAAGCRVVTARGDELLDCTMALGAVTLGYGDPLVTESVERAVRDGNVCGLPHTLEVEVAERLTTLIPCAERVRFLKSGAEGVAAAVRLARTHTGRDAVIGCGYFGWLDWCSSSNGVPDGVRRDYRRVPFDDIAALEEEASVAGESLAAIVIEPVIEREPDPEWLLAARNACERLGALLIFDEVKTGFRMDSGGYQRRTGVIPDLAVLGKGLANGYPLSAVVGRGRVMAEFENTWISSTLATETIGLAAARAVLDRHEREDVCAVLARHGAGMRSAVDRAIALSGAAGVRTEGVSEMWSVRFDDDAESGGFVRYALDEGVLFKRGPYNFASLVHRAPESQMIERAARAALSRLVEERP